MEGNVPHVGVRCWQDGGVKDLLGAAGQMLLHMLAHHCCVGLLTHVLQPLPSSIRSSIQFMEYVTTNQAFAEVLHQQQHASGQAAMSAVYCRVASYVYSTQELLSAKQSFCNLCIRHTSDYHTSVLLRSPAVLQETMQFMIANSILQSQRLQLTGQVVQLLKAGNK